MEFFRTLVISTLTVGAGISAVNAQIPTTAKPSLTVNTGSEPVAAGKFQPTWQSLKQYEVPEWFP